MLILMQGIPGSGKTTRAVEIKKAAECQGLQCVIVSTDDFFLRAGKYVFDKTQLGYNHAQCFFQTLSHLRNEKIDVVILDNCNIKRSHVAKYVAAARQQKRYTCVCKCSGAGESTHGVPKETVARMAGEMEDLTAFECVLPF